MWRKNGTRCHGETMIAGQASRDFGVWRGDLSCALLDLLSSSFSLLGPPATVQTMLSPEQSAYDGVDWGLGIGLQKSPTSPSFWHWGNNGGRYNAFFVGYPKRGLGAVVLTNSGNGLKLCRSIIPEAIGGDHPALRWPMVSI